MRIRLAIIFAALLATLGIAVVLASPSPAWCFGTALAALGAVWIVVDLTLLRPLSSVARMTAGDGAFAQRSAEPEAEAPEPPRDNANEDSGRPAPMRPGIADDPASLARAIERLQDLVRSRDAGLRMAEEKHEQTVKNLEARYRELFDSNPHPMIVFDTEHLEILAANKPAELRYGYTQHQFLRMTVRHLLADAVTSDTNAVIERLGLFGAGPVHDLHLRRDGSVIAVEVACSRMRYGGRPAAVALFADITERTRLEAENRRHTEALEALYASARKCAESLSVRDVALTIVGDAVRRFGMLGAWMVRVSDEECLAPVAACASDGDEPRTLDASEPSSCKPDREPPYPSWQAIRERSSVEYDPVSELCECERFGLAIPDRPCYGLALPLVARDQVFGVLHVLAPEGNGNGTASQRRVASICAASRAETRATLTSFALLAGAALMNAHLHEELQRTADRLDVRVRERTRELEAANKELEAFSYSVSHDLRAPLRAIDGFARLALLQYADSMDPECRTLLESVRCGAAEMGTLITSLLAFSRSARQPLHVRPVSVSDIVDAVIQGLTHEVAGRKIEWVIGDLPDCKADPVLLKQVYANLISNAAKFTAKRDQARIEVGADTGSETVYYVKDNGAGFDPARADRLFGVFQRLHRAEDFPGTGVGLATVQRIVARHGGRIWCHAAPNEGAAFFFTLQEHADG